MARDTMKPDFTVHLPHELLCHWQAQSGAFAALSGKELLKESTLGFGFDSLAVVGDTDCESPASMPTMNPDTNHPCLRTCIDCIAEKIQ